MHLEFDEKQCKAEVTNTRRIELSSSNCFQKLFKIQPQGLQMASKIHSGDVLGGQAEEKTFFNASRARQGPLWGTIWESKIVPNLSQKPFQAAYDIEERFGTVLEPFRV